MKLEEFKRKFFNQKLDKRQLFSNLKFTEDINDLRKIFRHYYKNNAFKAFVARLDQPTTFEELKEFKTIGYTQDLEKELNWTIASCEQNKEIINSFLIQKQEFENQFLLGNYESAELILQNIEDKNGISIWLIENIFLLKEYREGVKENWSQLSNLSKKISSPYVLFFIEQLSKRAEKNISYFRYKNLFNNLANELAVANVFNEYLCFKFSYSSFTGYANFEYYLWLENQLPIIDRYLTLVDVLVELFTNFKEIKKESLIDKVSLLNKIFYDSRLLQIENIVHNKIIHSFSLSDEIMSVFDSYGHQEYDFCLKRIPSLISKNPSCIELYEIYIKSLIEEHLEFKPTGCSELIDRSLESLFNLYSRNSYNEESVESLLKTVQSFSSSKWAKVLLGQVANKINLSNVVGNYQDYAFVNSGINNPRTITKHDFDTAGYETFREYFPESLSVKIQGYICAYESDLPELALVKGHIYEGRKLIKERNYDDAVSYYKEILDNTNLSVPYYEEVIQNLYNCYIATENLNSAIKLYCHNYLKNNYLVSSLESEDLIQEIDKIDIDNISQDIELPIFFNIVGTDSYSQYVAYDSFLNNLGIEKPTEITDFDHYDNEALVYFFRYVCKSEIMHYSLAFESSDDIENERIAICRTLLALDPNNEIEYYQEIAEITQQSSIRNAIREVNKGKISVNINQLKSSEASNVKESFSRFRELASFSKNKDLVAIDSTSEILKSYLSNYETEDELLDKVVFTNDPAFITFKIMFLELRDKFILSKEYGLDGYLSTRIRHGTLKNHLRSLFESLNLITQKTTDGTYVENIYWESRIQNEPLNYLLQDSLKTFSKDLDDLADYIIKELIQVKTEKILDKKNALFDYSFSQEELGTLFKHIRDANFKDYNEFLELITTILINRTESNLSVIRGVLTKQIQERFHDIITQLQNSIKANDIDKQLPELSSSILKSNTDIQQELENIAAWFNLTDQSSNLILNNETIIRTAVEITNSIYPNNKIIPLINDDTDLYLSGQYCPQLIYINRILLDNIIMHSGLPPEDLKVTISANLDQTVQTEEAYSTVLNLSYSNNIHSDIEQTSLSTKLGKLKSKFNDPDSKFENINFEGGSGLEKIKKILTIDLNINDYHIDFVVLNNNVDVKLSMRVTIKIVNDEKN